MVETKEQLSQNEYLLSGEKWMIYEVFLILIRCLRKEIINNDIKYNEHK